MGYFDCSVVPVRRGVLAHYLEIARRQGELWIRCGALEYRECLADDVAWGIATSFPRSVRLEDGEIVVLSWARYRSREHRDKVLARAGEDPWQALVERGELPFDRRRAFFGGFEEVLGFAAPDEAGEPRPASRRG